MPALKPTTAQHNTLTTYARAHGRNWKADLRHSWLTGMWRSYDNVPELQHMRNTMGTHWLTSYRVAKPVAASLP
jgi:hypothetical protein